MPNSAIHQKKELSSWADGDWVPITDTSDNNILKKINASNIGASGSASQSGSAYTIIGGSANSTTNGTALVNAYSTATSATPHGNALAADNRYTIILRPGIYTLTSAALDLDTNFIDIVGYDGATQNTILTSSGATLTVSASTPDIILANFTVHTSTATPTNSSSNHGYHITTSAATLKHYNIDFRADNDFAQMRGNLDYSARFENCRCLLGSTGNAGGSGGFGIGYASTETGVASGTFIKCFSGARSFGSCFNGATATASGVFVDCEAGNVSFGSGAAVNAATASGRFERCRAGDQSYAYGGVGGSTASGNFFYCLGGDNSFGSNVLTRNITVSGKFEHCFASSYSFGGWDHNSGGTGVVTITSVAVFLHCRASTHSFGGGISSSGSTAIAGTFHSCIGTSNCYGNAAGTVSATFVNCIGTTDCFGSNSNVTMSGTIKGCVLTGKISSTITGILEDVRVLATGTNEDAIVVGSGARVYNCSLIATGTGSSITAGSAITCKIAHCRTNKGIHANVTNLIGNPYISDDPEVS